MYYAYYTSSHIGFIHSSKVNNAENYTVNLIFLKVTRRYKVVVILQKKNGFMVL